MTDYGSGNLDRFQYTLTGQTITSITTYGAGGSTTNAAFITGPGGVGPTGGIDQGIALTSSAIIVTSAANVTQYNYSGTLIGNIGSGYSNPTALAASRDGLYVYVADTGNNLIKKVQISNGAVVNSVSYTGVHDLLVLPDGTVLASARSGTGGIVHYDANLGTATQLITNGSATFTSGSPTTFGTPTGMSFDSVNKILYVQQNPQNGAAEPVLAYSIGGSGMSLTASFNSSKSLQNATVSDAFGSDIGPDGKLYIAGLGSGKNGGGGLTAPAGYVNGVYAYSSAGGTPSVALSVSGWNNSTNTATNGFYSPTYLMFDVNINSAPEGTPEPGPTCIILAMSACGIRAVRRKVQRGTKRT